MAPKMGKIDIDYQVRSPSPSSTCWFVNSDMRVYLTALYISALFSYECDSASSQASPRAFPTHDTRLFFLPSRLDEN